MSSIVQEKTNLTYRVIAMNGTQVVKAHPEEIFARDTAERTARALLSECQNQGHIVTHASIRSVRRVAPIINEIAKVLV